MVLIFHWYYLLINQLLIALLFIFNFSTNFIIIFCGGSSKASENDVPNSDLFTNVGKTQSNAPSLASIEGIQIEKTSNLFELILRSCDHV